MKETGTSETGVNKLCLNVYIKGLLSSSSTVMLYNKHTGYLVRSSHCKWLWEQSLKVIQNNVKSSSQSWYIALPWKDGRLQSKAQALLSNVIARQQFIWTFLAHVHARTHAQTHTHAHTTPKRKGTLNREPSLLEEDFAVSCVLFSYWYWRIS